jgi:uncharacterized protein
VSAAVARLRALRLNARELLREPGLQKHVELTAPASDLGVDDDRIVDDVAIDLTATSGVDSVMVHGTLAMPWEAPCRRCLTDLAGTATIDVDEVYQYADDILADDDQTFPIENDQIDLASAVREHLLLELPDDVLCGDDCTGIRLEPGDAPDVATGAEGAPVRDERWAALDDLRLDD